jgi:putative flavoprotein involved in K+ transport
MPRAGRSSSVGSPRVPGLFFLGLHWMHTFKSGLFSGVGSDAEHLAEHMGLATGG